MFLIEWVTLYTPGLSFVQYNVPTCINNFSVELLIWSWKFISASADCDDYYGGGVCGGVCGCGGADEYAIDTAVVFPSTETTITKNMEITVPSSKPVCWVFNCMVGN